ncbi:VOC family protein [Deinococcus roseus]|nr:VOC family protein [Deinococcus roseus]
MTPQQTKPAGVLAFAHVGLTVSDLQHTIDFWQQVLGFTLQGTTDVGF